MIGTIPAVLTLCLATPMPVSARSQTSSEREFPEFFEAPDGWRADHGSAWRVQRDVDTGFARFVFGASLEPSRMPVDDAGALVHTQWRQRDPADPAGFEDGLSEGLRFVLAP